MVADFPQPLQHLEDGPASRELVGGSRSIQLCPIPLVGLLNRLVKLPLEGRELHLVGHLHLVWKVRNDVRVRLLTTEHKWADDLLQLLLGGDGSVVRERGASLAGHLKRPLVALLEIGPARGEISWQNKLELRMQVCHLVLHWRAGQGDADWTNQLRNSLDFLRNLGVVVLDLLRLIQDHPSEDILLAQSSRSIRAEDAVGRQEDIRLDVLLGLLDPRLLLRHG
mmetsp:Transcript_54333/g.127645  ORF Transcript_54333/g.127645 Transcript_54333/m.127645 type:complete len:224 (-) Transcript_54333:296-967(-)